MFSLVDENKPTPPTTPEQNNEIIISDNSITFIQHMWCDWNSNSDEIGNWLHDW